QRIRRGRILGQTGRILGRHRAYPDRLAEAASGWPVTGARPMTAVELGRRGRRGRERQLAEQAAALSAERSGTRHRIPDLSSLPPLLADRGELTALVERFRRSTDTRSGQALRHVTYAAVPHGAKTYLAAALVVGSGERLVWIARDAEIADRVADELRA